MSVRTAHPLDCRFWSDAPGVRPVGILHVPRLSSLNRRRYHRWHAWI
jgi:hypothetical protein